MCDITNDNTGNEGAHYIVISHVTQADDSRCYCLVKVKHKTTKPVRG